MKTKQTFTIAGIVLALAILAFAVVAQGDKARSLDPIRVIVIGSGAQNVELRESVLREFQKLRGVIVVKDRADIGIQLAASPFQGECRGVIAAVLTSTASGSDLWALAGSDWNEIARELVYRTMQDLERK